MSILCVRDLLFFLDKSETIYMSSTINKIDMESEYEIQYSSTIIYLQ